MVCYLDKLQSILVPWCYHPHKLQHLWQCFYMADSLFVLQIHRKQSNCSIPPMDQMLLQHKFRYHKTDQVKCILCSIYHYKHMINKHRHLRIDCDIKSFFTKKGIWLIAGRTNLILKQKWEEDKSIKNINFFLVFSSLLTIYLSMLKIHYLSPLYLNNFLFTVFAK